MEFLILVNWYKRWPGAMFHRCSTPTVVTDPNKPVSIYPQPLQRQQLKTVNKKRRKLTENNKKNTIHMNNKVLILKVIILITLFCSQPKDALTESPQKAFLYYDNGKTSISIWIIKMVHFKMNFEKESFFFFFFNFYATATHSLLNASMPLNIETQIF